jgi:hypothetical protein
MVGTGTQKEREDYLFRSSALDQWAVDQLEHRGLYSIIDIETNASSRKKALANYSIKVRRKRAGNPDLRVPPYKIQADIDILETLARNQPGFVTCSGDKQSQYQATNEMPELSDPDPVETATADPEPVQDLLIPVSDEEREVLRKKHAVIWD